MLSVVKLSIFTKILLALSMEDYDRNIRKKLSNISEMELSQVLQCLKNVGVKRWADLKHLDSRAI